MNHHQLRANCGRLTFAGVLLLTSCTTTHAPKAAFTYSQPVRKTHLNIALNITDELRKAQWEQRALLGMSDRMLVGQSIAENAFAMTQQTFLSVVRVDNGAPTPTPVDAVLTPNVAYIGRRPGRTPFSADSITLKLEWSLQDADGKLIWADTINGQGSNKAGWESVLAKTLETTFKKSQQAILSSEAIQQFVARKYPELALSTPAAPSKVIITRSEVREQCAALRSSDPEQVMDALKSLRRMNAPEAVPEILPCLLESHPNILRDACRTLAVLGNKDVIPAIEPLLKNSRSDVRTDARAAIAKLQAKP